MMFRRKTDAAIPAMAVTGRGRSKAETRLKGSAVVERPSRYAAPTGAPRHYNHNINHQHRSVGQFSYMFEDKPSLPSIFILNWMVEDSVKF